MLEDYFKIDHIVGMQLRTRGASGLKHTLLGHRELVITKHHQVLILRGTLNPFTSQPALILGLSQPKGRTLQLVGLAEPHEVYTGPLLKRARVPLDGFPSLGHANCTTRLHVICKLAEGILIKYTVCIANEDTKQYWPQYGRPRDAICHWCPSRH